MKPALASVTLCVLIACCVTRADEWKDETNDVTCTVLDGCTIKGPVNGTIASFISPLKPNDDFAENVALVYTVPADGEIDSKAAVDDIRASWAKQLGAAVGNASEATSPAGWRTPSCWCATSSR